MSRRRLRSIIVSTRVRTIALTAGAAVALGASGCAAFWRQQFANPVVELKNVEVRGIGLQGGSLDLLLDVYNPNPYRIDASRLTYRLFVDTAAIAYGEIDQLVTLVEKKKMEVRVPVTFTVNEMLGAARVLTKTGSVDYHVRGEVTLATPFGTLTRPYDGGGRFDSLRP